MENFENIAEEDDEEDSSSSDSSDSGALKSLLEGDKNEKKSSLI